MEALTFTEIKAQYPNQWVLIGNPELSNPEISGSVVSKLVSGVVLMAGKDKREIAEKGYELRKGYDRVSCVYTGEMPKMRKWVSVWRRQK